MDEEDLLVRLISQLREGFDDCRKQAGDSRILGYSILTDDSACSHVPAICTESNLINSQIRVADDYRFNPENWGITATSGPLQRNPGLLQELENDCSDEENDDNWHEEYRFRVYQLLVRSLANLRDSGYFNEWPHVGELFTIVWVVDSSLPNIRGRAWSKRLNAPSVHQEFIKWLDAQQWARA